MQEISLNLLAFLIVGAAVVGGTIGMWVQEWGTPRKSPVVIDKYLNAIEGLARELNRSVARMKQANAKRSETAQEMANVNSAYGKFGARPLQEGESAWEYNGPSLPTVDEIRKLSPNDVIGPHVLVAALEQVEAQKGVSEAAKHLADYRYSMLSLYIAHIVTHTGSHHLTDCQEGYQMEASQLHDLRAIANSLEGDHNGHG